MTSLMRGKKRLGWVLLLVSLFLFTAVLSAYAADWAEQGYPRSGSSIYRWYGVYGKTYTYSWATGNKHVSSLYARARYGDFNYIEMGTVKYVGSSPRVFMAYENWPDTVKYWDHRYQVKIHSNYYPSSGTWVSYEINNHQIGGSKWYASYNSTTMLHNLKLYIGNGTRTGETQCYLDTDAERWSGSTTDNKHSASWLKKKDSSGNWSYWGSIGTAGGDPLWRPVVGSSKWVYTTPQ